MLAEQLMVGPKLIQDRRTQVYAIAGNQLAQSQFRGSDGGRRTESAPGLSRSGSGLSGRALGIPGSSFRLARPAPVTGRFPIPTVPARESPASALLHYPASGKLVSYPNNVE